MSAYLKPWTQDRNKNLQCQQMTGDMHRGRWKLVNERYSSSLISLSLSQPIPPFVFSFGLKLITPVTTRLTNAAELALELVLLEGVHGLTMNVEAAAELVDERLTIDGTDLLLQ